MSHVREILKNKGSAVWSVSPDSSVSETIKLMADKNIGAVLVLEGSKIAGIFSERDFTRHAAKSNFNTEQTKVKDLMTTRILFVGPDHSTEECMSLMASKRIRHLPVMEQDKVIGLISIGDVVIRIIQDQKFSITQLESYVTGGPY